MAFQDWVTRSKVPWQDLPTADYDMRGYWQAQQANDPQARTTQSQFDGRMHFPDTFKTPYHRTFSRESKYALPNAPYWNENRLIDDQGNIVADETPQPRKKRAAFHAKD